MKNQIQKRVFTHTRTVDIQTHTYRDTHTHTHTHTSLSIPEVGIHLDLFHVFLVFSLSLVSPVRLPPSRCQVGAQWAWLPVQSLASLIAMSSHSPVPSRTPAIHLLIYRATLDLISPPDALFAVRFLPLVCFPLVHSLRLPVPYSIIYHLAARLFVSLVHQPVSLRPIRHRISTLLHLACHPHSPLPLQ